MYRICIPMGIVLLITSTLSAQTVSLDNGVVKMKISLTGGTITELGLFGVDVNPLHDYGHFLCFDHWGPSSPEDEALGIPFHGEASKITWTLNQEPSVDAGQYYMEISCLLPIVNLGMNRKIYLNDNTSVFKVVEEITNHTDSLKVFNLVQHPTIGAPFLDENTIVDTEVDSGFSQLGNLPPASEDVITWPQTVVDGDSTDLRYLSVDHSWKSAVVTFILDEKEEYRWVTAVNPTLNLMLGYIWPASDYPWLNLWLRLRNNSPFARGLEFGSTGLHQAWPELLEMEEIFGKKLYEEIGVNDTIIKTYYTFMSQIPSDYEGVESVTLEEEKILVEAYGKDPGKTIELAIRDTLTGMEPIVYDETEAIILGQNYPNPFYQETTIVYNLDFEGRVILEVFNATGQLVQTLVDGFQGAGDHRVSFHTSGLPEGMYSYRIRAGNNQSQNKMILGTY